MGETTPDIRQLSMCCGKVLVWRDYVTFDGRYSADCSGCGADLCVEAMEQARELTATEKLLLARIAELEAAQRWRVTAEELPPVGEWVIGWWPVGPIPCDVVSFDGAFWNAAGAHGIRPPDQWQPIARAASSRGADVPKGE